MVYRVLESMGVKGHRRKKKKITLFGLKIKSRIVMPVVNSFFLFFTTTVISLLLVN